MGPFMEKLVTAASNIAVGKSIKCATNDPSARPNDAVYRYNGNNEMSLYPNAPVAESYDALWKSPAVIDCANIRKTTDDLEFNCINI
jgi:hypothetical protein